MEFAQRKGDYIFGIHEKCQVAPSYLLINQFYIAMIFIGTDLGVKDTLEKAFKRKHAFGLCTGS